MALIDKLKNLQNDNTERDLYSRLNFSLKEISDRVKQEMISEFENSVSKIVKDEISKIKVRDGRDGKDGKGLDGRDGKNGQDGKNANENKIIEEIMKKLPPISMRSGSRGGGSTLRVDNLSSQANGSQKTFTTTYKIGLAHLVFYSSFPSILLPTTDYTASGTTLTLGANVPAPQTGQSLAIIYEDAT